MGTKAIPSLPSGRSDSTFEQLVTALQNYGFRQAVFEVERLNGQGNAVPGEVVVLRPSATPEAYPHLKPGDRVLCPGLGHDAAGAAILCRIRRMAEGMSRSTITERAPQRH